MPLPKSDTSCLPARGFQELRSVGKEEENQVETNHPRESTCPTSHQGKGEGIY